MPRLSISATAAAALTAVLLVVTPTLHAEASIPTRRVAAPQDPAPTAASNLQQYLDQARGELAEGKGDAALKTVRMALERDDRNLAALSLQAEIAAQIGDVDTAVHTLHRWLEVYDAQKKPPLPRKERKAIDASLRERDTEAGSWAKLQKVYVNGLLALGKEYQKRKDWLGAIDAYTHLLQVDPENKKALAAITDIRRTGGKEVAVEDVFAGTGDPSDGRSAADIAAEDAKHSDWDNAYTKDGVNYRYRTNAGFLVLQTSSIAMEQMNRFYRRFFKFKEDGGKTPKIEIRVFKNRDEYLELGAGPPAKWSGGHFIGSAVETYVGGVTGKDGIREMYRTLFHEAAHQFVSLTGPMVPGWLNEAYASFFEGCVILSNGTVKWNLPPPGRLFPLASRMEQGWMKSPSEAAPDGGGDFPTPEGAPPFRMVVEGNYRWGPPWYAPTWGVVYFLYNYRTDDGRPIYRDALHEYYKSFKRGRPNDPIANFEEIVIRGAKLSPVESIDELDPIWKKWILALRDRESGKTKGGDELLRYADAAMERGEKEMALEFLEEARENDSDNLELAWRTAKLLEDLGRKPRAAAVYREFKRSLEVLGLADDDERHAEAEKKILRLDPLTRRYQTVKKNIATKGLELAKSYEARELPTMALEIARRMTASYSIPEALAYYIDLATRTGKTLARWRVAYNERDLSGWSGDQNSYQAYGRSIRANVPDHSEGGGLFTQQLTCDVTFDADFSLEAEMRIEERDGPAGSLMGMCFGRKGDSDFHAVMLHAKSFMDIASNRGGNWEIHDHRQVPALDGDWHTLRIDVTGSALDVYFDGLYVRALEFASPAAVRGGFGLITGVGRAEYRNIRLLVRDRFDPATRVERDLAMAAVAADATLRQPGTFAGIRPPDLVPATWVQGEPTTLKQLRGKPVLLVFWSPRQDQVIPCTDYYAHLIQRGQAAGLETVIMCDGGTGVQEALDYLKDHPMAGARIGIDSRSATYDAYWIKQGGHGMPRVLLLDGDGKVTFEGDPGLSSGVGWKPGGGATYVDAPFEKLIGS